MHKLCKCYFPSERCWMLSTTVVEGAMYGENDVEWLGLENKYWLKIVLMLPID